MQSVLTNWKRHLQQNQNTTKLISLGIYFVLADLFALAVVAYFISYPDDCLKKIATTSGFVISSNQYQTVAHKIADTIKNRKTPGGQMLLVGVIVDQNGKVYAVDADRHEVLIDENPQTENRTELWGGVNLTNLPGNSVFGMLTLTDFHLGARASCPHLPTYGGRDARAPRNLFFNASLAWKLGNVKSPAVKRLLLLFRPNLGCKTRLKVEFFTLPLMSESVTGSILHSSFFILHFFSNPEPI